MTGTPNLISLRDGKLRPSFHHPLPVHLPRVPHLGGHLRCELGRRRSLFIPLNLDYGTVRSVVCIIWWKNMRALFCSLQL